MQTRWIILAGLLATLAVFPARAGEDGLVTRPSKYTVAETADHLEAGLRQAGATVFAHIDYTQSAHDAELELNPLVLILYGNPGRELRSWPSRRASASICRGKSSSGRMARGSVHRL
jgi:hypothetical protein